MPEDLGVFKAVQFEIICTEELATILKVDHDLVDKEYGVLTVKDKIKLSDGNYKIVAVPRFKQ